MIIVRIALNDLLKFTRDKMGLVVMFLIPVVFTFVMSIAFANIDDFVKDERICIGIVDKDNSSTTERIINILNKDSMVKLRVMKEEEITNRVSQGIIHAGFILPKGFESEIKSGKIPQIETVMTSKSARYIGATQKVRDAIGVIYIEENVGKEVDKKLIEANLVKEDLISAKFEGYNFIKKNTDYRARTGLGYIAMFIMISVAFGTQIMLIERQEGTWQRMLVSSASPFSMFAGKILGVFVKSWIQCAFLLIFLKLVMGLQFANFVSLFFILNIYIVCAISIMMFISVVSQTNAQYSNITNLVVLSTSMLAGCWWPIEVVPYIMQKIALLMPQYWMVVGLSNESGVVLPIVILISIGTIFMVLSLVFNRMKNYKI